MAAAAGAFPPGARGQISAGSRGGSLRDPQDPPGGPGLAHKSRVGLDNVIKRASPESRSSDFWLGVMRDGSNWNHGSNFCEN